MEWRKKVQETTDLMGIEYLTGRYNRVKWGN
jgi:hypothetical protein